VPWATWPQVDAALIDRLITAFAPEQGALAVMPTIDGQRGNPVLWSRRFFSGPDGRSKVMWGARNLINRYGAEAVVEVPVTGKGALGRCRHAGGTARRQGRDRRGVIVLLAPASG